MLPKRLFACLLLFSGGGPVHAQLGGENTYAFLNVYGSARVAALGGNQIAVQDSDINLAIYAPSLLNAGIHSQLLLSYVNHSADINFGHVAYAHHVKNRGTFSASLQYINYGTFTEADETGAQLGEFGAADYNLSLGYGCRADSLFTVGANLKVLYSNYERYTSLGTAVDLSGTFAIPGSGFTAALLMKNLGVQLKSYTDGNRESLPFEIQLGISQRLKHAPLRLSLMMNNLQKWDLTYADPDQSVGHTDPLTGELVVVKPPGFGHKLLLHVTANAEIFLSKNIWLALGYNQRRRQELKLTDSPGLVGFSFGTGVKIKRFSLSYAHVNVHRASASDYITISTRISDFLSH